MEEKDELIIEDAKLVYCNFEGLANKYNADGIRNFSVKLSKKDADRLIADGWRVKFFKNQVEGDPFPAHLPVKVQFGKYPPKVIYITKKNKVQLTEKNIKRLDKAEFKRVDLVINPYNWSSDRGTGIKAYLKAGYFTIKEDFFAEKYDVPDAGLESEDGDLF
jgi:hypothetical protein